MALLCSVDWKIDNGNRARQGGDQRGQCQMSFGRGQLGNAYLFTALRLDLWDVDVAIVGTSLMAPGFLGICLLHRVECF